jgi:molybdenum cofactor cytidylyltransferase
MAEAASFCGVILAAGASSRMGRDKALLPWPPDGTGTFLSAAIEMLGPHTEMVIVVGGANAASLEPIVYARGAYLVRNPAPERGQLSSLQIGLQEVLNRGRDTALVTLVDRPPAASATVAKLRCAYLDASGEVWAVVPEFGGRHGHPVVMGRDLIGAMLRAPATATAREVEHAHQDHILYLPVDDSNVTANVNTPEEYAQLKS